MMAKVNARALGRVRLSRWGGTMERTLEVCPRFNLTFLWPTDWARSWSLLLGLSWLRWSCGVAVEVRHG